jgi:hypothetical protein
MCPYCFNLHLVDGHGSFKKHKAKGDVDCAGSGSPTKNALKTGIKVVGGGLPGSGK